MRVLAAATSSVESTSTPRWLRSQPTVSHHTKALAEAGLIVGERRGKWVWWHVVPERLAALQAALAPTQPS
jgi:DNA-binding transcriptional ArsR family regulator